MIKEIIQNLNENTTLFYVITLKKPLNKNELKDVNKYASKANYDINGLDIETTDKKTFMKIQDALDAIGIEYEISVDTLVESSKNESKEYSKNFNEKNIKKLESQFIKDYFNKSIKPVIVTIKDIANPSSKEIKIKLDMFEDIRPFGSTRMWEWKDMYDIVNGNVSKVKAYMEKEALKYTFKTDSFSFVGSNMMNNPKVFNAITNIKKPEYEWDDYIQKIEYGNLELYSI